MIKYNRSMANEAVNQVIVDYYRDFSTLNVQAILPYFNEPSLLVGPQGVIPIPDRAALAAVFGPVMEGLRTKGYGRSELELDYVKSLSSSAAWAATGAGGRNLRAPQNGERLEIRHGYPSRSKHAGKRRVTDPVKFLLDQDLLAEISRVSQHWGHSVTVLRTVLPVTAAS